MMKMQRMSEKRWQRLKSIIDGWFLKAFERKPINISLVEGYLTHIYKSAGFSKPSFLYAEGPIDAQTIFSETSKSQMSHAAVQRNLCDLFKDLFDRSIEHTVSIEVIGSIFRRSRFMTDLKLQLEANTEKHSDHFTMFSYDSIKGIQLTVYYEFLKENDVFHSSIFNDFCTFMEEGGVFFSIYSPDQVILCPYPSSVCFNERRQFHSYCLMEPSVCWEDDLTLVFNNGVYIPEVFWKPIEDINPRLILKEKNAGVRKEIIKKVGIEKVIEAVGAEVLDGSRKGYELLKLNMPDMRVKPVYLKMQNPSTKEWHIEGIPPDISTVEDALAWRDGENAYIVPSELT